MAFLYPGLYNSSYVPTPLELKFARNPSGYLSPYFFAVLFSFLIAGIIVAQAASYYNSKFFNEDPTSLRLHVAIVLLLSTLKLIQVGAAGHMDFSLHYGDYNFLTHKNWVFRISVLSATIVSATVQVFFIKRVSKFSHHAPVFLVPTLLAWLGSIGSAIWVTVVFPEDWATRSHSFVLAGRVAPGFTLVCDILITGFAMYYLLRSALAFPQESPVYRIIRVMLESAVPPCITALLNVIFDDQAAGGYVFLFVALTPLLQTFSMIYSLNSRVYYRQRAEAKARTMGTDGPRRPHSLGGPLGSPYPSPFSMNSEKEMLRFNPPLDIESDMGTPTSASTFVNETLGPYTPSRSPVPSYYRDLRSPTPCVLPSSPLARPRDYSGHV
ncbi:hypothetical protein AURDEDRAFT_117336 [Auricularia subglabra TFB-10046 SS5]|uniref:DUF6534 domain-containing protein n=1 Tax=Auricularia subglabra (strain TFB-10046 / SS5) TaxID=717982 RepID=J0WS46_AURST|nr:hypothetical protein AURDEDRAFT_117336 [Auricularia subglabra TFB-10046 SS5]